MTEEELRQFNAAVQGAVRDGIREGMRAVNQANKPGATTSSGANFNRSSSGGGALGAKGVLEGVSREFDRAVNQAGGTATSAFNTFAGQLPILGDALTNVSGYVEESYQTFQALSKVGAGLNGDFGEMRKGAADTRMTLGEFANMVGQNSQLLAGYNNGVEGGIRAFRNLSNAMYEGPTPPIEGFMALGMSIKDANEFIIKNTEFQRRDSKFRRADGSLNSQLMLESSQQMAKSLDVMAKVAGKELKQMQDDIVERQRSGATQARLRLLEQQGVAGASDAYAQAQASLQNAPQVARDLLDDLVQTGAPMSEATKAFAATNAEAYAALVQQANAIKRGDSAMAAGLGEQATAAAASYANSTQGLTLATMAQLSPIAQQQATNLEQMGPLIDNLRERARQIGEPLNDTASYVRTFNSLLQSIGANQVGQMSGGMPGTEIMNQLNRTTVDLANNASRLNTSIADQLSNNQTVISGIRTAAETVAAVIANAGTVINGAINSIPGANASTGGNPDRLLSEDRAAFEALQSAIRDGNVQVQNENLQKLGDLVDKDGMLVRLNADAVEAKEQQLEDGTFTGNDNILPGEPRRLAIGGGFNFGDIMKVGEQGPETLIAGMDGAIIPNMKSMLNRMPDMARQMQDQMMGLAAPMSEAAQQAAAQFSSGGNNSLEQKLDILNQTMLQLVNINSMHAQTATKQLRTSKAVGNFMNGIGRV